MKRAWSGFILLGAMMMLMADNRAADRPQRSLDGAWEFRFAPDDRGDAESWFGNGVPFDRQVRVPGCWDAQGIGEPTDKLRHNAIGVGWYRRRFQVPADWRGRRIWLRVGGAHRTARAWLNGRFLGEHAGYPVAFRFDLTPWLAPSGRQALVIAVDSRWNRDRDPLAGTFDVLDFMDLTWGGLFESVRLEATGDTYLEDVFVQPDPAAKAAAVEVEIRDAEARNGDSLHPETRTVSSGGRNGNAGALTLEYAAREWSRSGSPSPPIATGRVSVPRDERRLRWALPLDGAPSWTPESPRLLSLDLTLLDGGHRLDRRSIRFGLRRLEIRGGDFYLNNERFLLRGYGDDWTFPRDLAPAGVSTWRRYLAFRRSFGFNGVRHHSAMPGDSYLEAADEIGMLVQPELPIAYEPFYRAATPEGRDVYRRVWRDYIRQMRNHPSVFSWCMGNELYGGIDLGPELYRTAKALDPTRPVLDTDGVDASSGRDTVDYLSVQFNENALPWGPARGKYRVSKPPSKPLIVHEASNISTLPDPRDLSGYDGVVKPEWLERMTGATAARGRDEDLPSMLEASHRLQASLLKLNIEAMRLSPEIDGYHQWLFRDYWRQSTGIVDQFDRPRALSARETRRFNGPAVLLWDRDRVSYRSGETLAIRVYLSDFRPADAPAPASIRARVGNRIVDLDGPAGASRRGLIGPWTGTLALPAVSDPRGMKLRVSAGSLANEWPLWVFPEPRAGSSAPYMTEPPGRPDVRVASRMTRGLLDALDGGASVLLTGDYLTFPTLPASYKPAWWHGDDTGDHSFGNRIVPHPALHGFPNEGYGDLQLAGAMDRRPVILLDEVPGMPEPIVECLDVPWRMRRKAYLFEARVGKGRLLVSTLDVSPDRRSADPAARWLFDRLARYAGGPDFKPEREIPVSWLRSRVEERGLPEAAGMVEGFDRVVEWTEDAGTWPSYREESALLYPVRQTDGRQRLKWRTAPVAAGERLEPVIFAWAGGMGFRSQPEGGYFTLSVEGRPEIRFDVDDPDSRWVSPDGEIRLRFIPLRSTPEDRLGLFLLTVPAGRTRSGQAVELEVTASAAGSRRWFGLNPYRDAIDRDATP